MTKKYLWFYFFTCLLVGILFSYWLVFAWPVNKEISITSISKNLTLGVWGLEKNLLVISWIDSQSKIQFLWDCGISSHLLSHSTHKKVYEISLANSCKKEYVDVMISINGVAYFQKYKITSLYQIYSKFLDYSDKSLLLASEKINQAIIKKESLIDHENSFQSLQKQREIQELTFIKDILLSILEKRKEKYKIPVRSAKIPTRYDKLPNSWRPYRSWYTDGIHHGIDFDGDKSDPLLSLDDGIVIRVVKWFVFSDLWQLNTWPQLAYEEKLTNLDILRWNQVWVKTMKWDVAFYSHLETVFDDIKPWIVVKKWQPLGTMGVTWVPEKWYHDYHLHLAIQKNPYIPSKIWKNTFMDYMKWDWALKSVSRDNMNAELQDMFEK